jgi:hypothetical protein
VIERGRKRDEGKADKFGYRMRMEGEEKIGNREVFVSWRRKKRENGRFTYRSGNG